MPKRKLDKAYTYRGEVFGPGTAEVPEGFSAGEPEKPQDKHADGKSTGSPRPGGKSGKKKDDG